MSLRARYTANIDRHRAERLNGGLHTPDGETELFIKAYPLLSTMQRLSPLPSIRTEVFWSHEVCIQLGLAVARRGCNHSQPRGNFI